MSSPLFYATGNDADDLFVGDLRELESINCSKDGVMVNFKSGKTVSFPQWTAAKQGLQLRDAWTKYNEGGK